MEHGWTVRSRKSESCLHGTNSRQGWRIANCLCYHQTSDWEIISAYARDCAGAPDTEARACKHMSLMIQKINLCLSQKGQHCCVIRMHRQRQDSQQFLWECNTLHRYGVEGEIRNIKPTVSPDVRNHAQVNRRLWSQHKRMWKWFVSGNNLWGTGIEKLWNPQDASLVNMNVWRKTIVNNVAIRWQMQQRERTKAKWNRIY